MGVNTSHEEIMLRQAIKKEAVHMGSFHKFRKKYFT